MPPTKRKWIAALIAAHPDHKVFGRIRLQKEVKLLQRLGFPTDYYYMIHFYGPYSESLHEDVCVMEAQGAIKETQSRTRDGNDCFILEAADLENLPDVGKFQPQVDRLNRAGTVILELAATYDSFREQGDGHEAATTRLRRKKGAKCEGGNEAAALDLLRELGLGAN
jgi:uncharacterized protein YwgA